MKKKITGMILIIIMSFSLVACGFSELNEDNTAAAENIVTVIDNYLDGNISASAALNSIEKYSDKMDNEGEPDSYLTVSISITSIEIELLKMQTDGTGDNKEILYNRNKIADFTGLRKRRKI